MKRRTHNAEVLETDYLECLRRNLGDRDPIEANEIIQDVREHIEEALLECAEREVSGETIEEILKKLGPPEQFLGNPDSHSQAKPPAEEASRGQIPSINRENYISILKKLWWGNFVYNADVFIPHINLELSAIIGFIIIAGTLIMYRDTKPHKFNGLGAFTLLILILGVCSFVIGLLASTSLDYYGIVNIIVAVVVVTLSLVWYWWLMGALSEMACDANNSALSEKIFTWRIQYLLISILLDALLMTVTLFVHHIASVSNRLDFLIYCLFLPFTWLIGYLGTLRPISRTIQAVKDMEGSHKPSKLASRPRL